MAAAAARPCASATSWCSIRTRPPCSTESYSHTSPAAQMPGAEVSRLAEHATPPVSPSSSLAARASITSGIAPVPITTMSASSVRPDAVTTRSTRSRALEPLEPVGRHELDAVLAQQGAEEAAGRRAEVRGQRRVLEHDHRAAPAEPRERRGDLAGDVGAADEDHVLGLGRVRADRVGVAERAQVVDALELPSVDPQPADVRAGRDERDAEAHDLLGRERRGPLGGVEPHHARARRQLDRALRVPRRVVEQARVAVLLAGQVGLRRGRALVRQIRLAPHQQHAAGACARGRSPLGEAPVVQRLGAGGARGPAADDQRADLAVSHRRRSPRRTGA